jgi:hypothetical protein
MEKYISQHLLPEPANDNAIGAVVVFVRALPASQQRQVRSRICARTRADRYLSPAAAARVLQLANEFDPADRELL